VKVPVMVCIFMIIAYIMFGALVFSSWEDWCESDINNIFTAKIDYNLGFIVA
jgi:hypothetical protein